MANEGGEVNVEVDVSRCVAYVKIETMMRDVESGVASVHGWGLQNDGTLVGHAKHQVLGDMVRGDIPYNVLMAVMSRS